MADPVILPIFPRFQPSSKLRIDFLSKPWVLKLPCFSKEIQNRFCELDHGSISKVDSFEYFVIFLFCLKNDLFAATDFTECQFPVLVS